MAASISPWKLLLYPELRRFEPGAQENALRKASDVSFDWIELVGLALALLVTVLLTRYAGTGMSLADRFGAAISNFIVAIPLLLALGGPFYVRRTRRGLKAMLSDRPKAAGEDK
jgi:hypothetical protein